MSETNYDKAIPAGWQWFLKKNMIKILKGIQKDWVKFLEPVVDTLAPVIGMAIRAKNKNLQIGQAIRNSYQQVRSYH